MPVPVTTKTVTAPAVGAGNSAVYQKTITDAVQEIQTNLNLVVTQPVAEVQMTAGQSIPNTTWTSVSFGSAPYVGGIGMTTSASGVTVSAAGRYKVDTACVFVANSTGIRIAGIQTAAAVPSQFFQNVQITPGTGALCNATATFEIGLTAGQTVYLMVYQSSGAALNLQAARLVVRALTD